LYFLFNSLKYWANIERKAGQYLDIGPKRETRKYVPPPVFEDDDDDDDDDDDKGSELWGLGLIWSVLFYLL